MVQPFLFPVLLLRGGNVRDSGDFNYTFSLIIPSRPNITDVGRTKEICERDRSINVKYANVVIHVDTDNSTAHSRPEDTKVVDLTTRSLK